MGGERYYTFVRPRVRFVVLDSNMMDAKQLAWAEQTLATATEPWKIVYFHHPIYSDGGRHGSNVELRVLIEPLLVKHGVRIVFNGHEHFYERTTPQKGVTYFIAGSGGQLRKGNVRRSPLTAAAFDQDQSIHAGGDCWRAGGVPGDLAHRRHGRFRRHRAASDDVRRHYEVSASRHG